MVIIYDMDILRYNEMSLIINFKKIIDGIENNVKNPPVLTFVRRSVHNSDLTIGSDASLRADKFEEILLRYAGINIKKIQTIRLFTERLLPHLTIPPMIVESSKKMSSYEFNIDTGAWEVDFGAESIFDTKRLVLMSETHMTPDVKTNRDDDMLLITYNIDKFNIIAHKNFGKFLKKSGINSSIIKRIVFERIVCDETTMDEVSDNPMYENFEDLILHGLNIDVGAVNTSHITTLVSREDAKSVDAMLIFHALPHSVADVYDFDTKISEWIICDKATSFILEHLISYHSGDYNESTGGIRNDYYL